MFPTKRGMPPPQPPKSNIPAAAMSLVGDGDDLSTDGAPAGGQGDDSADSQVPAQLTAAIADLVKQYGADLVEQAAEQGDDDSDTDGALGMDESDTGAGAMGQG